MKPPIPPLCLLCKHYSPPAGEKPTATCGAFPSGIPDEIWFSDVDHRKPYRGESVVFEAAEGITEQDVEDWDAGFAILEGGKAGDL